MTEATRRELADAGQLDSWRGVVLLTLAQRIDAVDDAHGLVALVREFRAALAEAHRGTATPPDVVDELRERRQRRQRWQPS